MYCTYAMNSTSEKMYSRRIFVRMYCTYAINSTSEKNVQQIGKSSPLYYLYVFILIKNI